MNDIEKVMADIRESAERLITQEMAALMTLVDLGMPMRFEHMGESTNKGEMNHEDIRIRY